MHPLEPPHPFCVATFHATYAVLRAEKLLAALGVQVRTVPVPRQISSSCGIAVRFACDHGERLRGVFAALAEDLEGIYRLGGDGTYSRVEF